LCETKQDIFYFCESILFWCHLLDSFTRKVQQHTANAYSRSTTEWKISPSRPQVLPPLWPELICVVAKHVLPSMHSVIVVCNHLALSNEYFR